MMAKLLQSFKGKSTGLKTDPVLVFSGKYPVFFFMRLRTLTALLLLWSCSSAPDPVPDAQPVSPQPVPAKVTEETMEETQTLPTPYDQGLLTEYDIWDFLSRQPDEMTVRETLGTPDSVWVDEDQSLQIWYYYVPEIHDYNSIEFDPATKRATGFEWD